MNWKSLHTIGLALILIIMLLIIPLIPGLNWPANLVALLVFSLIIGHGITGSWKGVFVDERNKVSLSRLQLLLWTIILLSAFITVALNQINGSKKIEIVMDEQLWVLMGISTTSLIGSPLIKSTKTTKSSNKEETKKTIQSLGGTIAENGAVDDTSEVNTNGQIVVNKSIKKAGIADLFKGEETGNAAAVDLAKTQMFFFTMITMIAYIVLLYSKIYGDGIINNEFTFPSFDSSLLGLLGISHSGYLVNKAIPHSKENI